VIKTKKIEDLSVTDWALIVETFSITISKKVDAVSYNNEPSYYLLSSIIDDIRLLNKFIEQTSVFIKNDKINNTEI